MIVNFEFLDSEPIDNVITNLNYQIDKTVFFGYANMISAQRERLESFLTRYCDASEVEFVTVPRGKLKDILDIVRREVEQEKTAGNKVFFDITGGETLPMVAFGILSTETETPMHIFNVEKNRLKEQEEGAGYEISKDVPRRTIDFTIEMFIELMGAAIRKNDDKQSKQLDDEESLSAAKKLVSLFDKNISNWTRFSTALRTGLRNDGDGLYHIDYNKVADKFYPGFVNKLKQFMQQLHDAGLIEYFSNEEGEKCFRFKKTVRENLVEDGAALELKTCIELREKYGHAQAGVHLDWDGTINIGPDVTNEIDVVALDGYTPIIVSCKCGNQANTDALYELEIVARRFGGSYARKMLVSAFDMTPANKLRAEEMGIELWILDSGRKVKNYNN